MSDFLFLNLISMNRLRLNLDLEKSLIPGSLLITGANNEAEYLGSGNPGEFLTIANGLPLWKPLPDARRPFVKSGHLLATSLEDILETDPVWHSGKLTIGATETTLPFSSQYSLQVGGNQFVSEKIRANLLFSQLAMSNSLFVTVDPVNGDDTRDFSEYTISTTGPVTSGIVFKSLDRVIDFINASSAFYFYVALQNTSVTTPVTLTANKEINSKYVTIFGSNPAPGYLQLNGYLMASVGTQIQLNVLDLTASGSSGSSLYLDGGEICLFNTTVRQAPQVNDLFYAALGHLYLDRTTFVFGADNQSLIRPAGSYGITVVFSSHGNCTYTLGSYTGLRLLKAGYDQYNVHIRCFGSTVFPAGLNIQGGIFQYGETQVQGQSTFDATNTSYKSVLYGATPIRTPDLNSLSTDLGGTLKTVVVDDRGVFGVQTQIPVTSQAVPLRSTSTTGSVTETDHTVYVVNDSTAVTQTLPDPSTVSGRIYVIARGTGSTGTITINPGSGQIEALAGTLGTTTSLAALGSLGAKVTFQSDGTNWRRISNG